MRDTTLCYIEKDNCFLMLYRNKKKNDLNAGKWIGVGGKCEPGETPDECLLREVWEETGVKLTSYRKCGVIDFLSEIWPDERMYLYTADSYEGEINMNCPEGELAWIPKEKVMDLNLWEGDRIFLKDMVVGKEVDLVLRYDKEDKLAEVIDRKKDGRMQMKPKAVIFDMDGVIFDTEKLCLDCWTILAEKNNLQGMNEAFVKCVGTNAGRTKEIMLEQYGADFDYDGFAAEASKLFHEVEERDGLPLKPGVVEMLEALKGAGIPIGLASSTRLASVEKELKDAGLYDYFQVVVGGDLLKKSKPEPDIYLMACEKMGVEPKDAYAIEDSHNGIRSAYSAGMHPLMVPDLLPPTDEMREKSEVIVKDLFELKQWFGL